MEFGSNCADLFGEPEVLGPLVTVHALRHFRRLLKRQRGRSAQRHVRLDEGCGIGDAGHARAPG